MFATLTFIFTESVISCTALPSNFRIAVNLAWLVSQYNLKIACVWVGNAYSSVLAACLWDFCQPVLDSKYLDNFLDENVNSLAYIWVVFLWVQKWPKI